MLSLLRKYYFGVVCARQEKEEKRPALIFHAPSTNPRGKWKARDCNVLQQYKMRDGLLGSDVFSLFLQQENKKVAFVRAIRDVEHCCSEFLRDL